MASNLEFAKINHSDFAKLKQNFPNLQAQKFEGMDF